MRNLGKKIVVVGVSASGKSTFSKKLAEKTAITVTLMDSIMWKPGWNYIGDDEVSKKLETISNNPEWIIEGYIVKPARIFLFDKADTIIYLDYPPTVASFRYIKRWWQHRINARPELPGSPEKFSLKFLKLVYTKGETVLLNKFLSEERYQQKIIKLFSSAEAIKFLDNID
jgi:adenylate kinase family enzyme